MLIAQNSMHGGIQKLYRFPNGYGASVVCHSFSYGGSKGLYELGVIYFPDESEHFRLTYDTPITGDVIGNIPFDDIDTYLGQIKALQPLTN